MAKIYYTSEARKYYHELSEMLSWAGKASRARLLKQDIDFGLPLNLGQKKYFAYFEKDNGKKAEKNLADYCEECDEAIKEHRENICEIYRNWIGFDPISIEDFDDFIEMILLPQKECDFRGFVSDIVKDLRKQIKNGELNDDKETPSDGKDIEFITVPEFLWKYGEE